MYTMFMCWEILFFKKMMSMHINLTIKFNLITILKNLAHFLIEIWQVDSKTSLETQKT